MPHTPPTSPGPADALRIQSRDVEQVKLLAIFYFVHAGLALFGLCIGLLYIGLGITIALAPPSDVDPQSSRVAEFMSWFFIGIGSLAAILSVIMCVLQVRCGRCLRKFRNRTYCMTVAGITCISVPLGTVLGILTFIVLARPPVAQLFRQGKHGEAR